MGEKSTDDRLERMRERMRATVAGSGGPKAVAKLSGIPLNTLAKYLNGAVSDPSAMALGRIAEACGVDVAWLLGMDAKDAGYGSAAGLGESDLVAYIGPGKRMPANHGSWRVSSRALDAIGVLPGDVIDFVLGGEPRRGDVVVAQFYRPDRPAASTVLRVFEPPYLIIRSFDSSLDHRPVLIEEGKVAIMGRFHRLTRDRVD